MKTLRTISLIALVALLLIAVGCEKEEYAEPPVYGKIYCDKEHPVVGDTVKLYVKIDKQGNRINSAEYRWKIRNDAGTSEFSQRVFRNSGQKSLTAQPTLTWVVKDWGDNYITLTATFSYTMGDVNSVMKGSAYVSGTIKTYSK